MKTTFDINLIRYINLFEKVTNVRTSNCFVFNNIMFFAVPKNLVYKAVGENGKNVKKLSETMAKRIKIIGEPENEEDIKRFLTDLISPVEPKNIEVGEKEITITTSKINKASLIGRDKQRFKELKKIVEDYFGKDLKIV